MKVHILDPGLFHVRGHQYDWSTRISAQLVRSGHEVSVYGHLNAEAGALEGYEKGVRARRYFALNPNLPKSGLDPICGEIERQVVGTQSIVNDLRKLPPADLWLWPTGFAYQLRGCAQVPSGARVSACLQTPPDTGFGVPFAEPGEWWRFAAKRLAKVNGRIRTIGVLEPECLATFQHFAGDLDPVVLPVPYDGLPVRRSELKIVGFVGGRRLEQGGNIIGKCVERCLKAGFQVLTQAHENVPPLFQKDPNLIVVGHEGDFASKVERCDLVVAPYRWEEYTGGRGSGVIYQTIASGVPCVAPRGSSPGRTLARIGSTSLFNQFTPSSIFGAILTARTNYRVLAEAAYRGALEWREHNGVAKFVDAMINGTRH